MRIYLLAFLVVLAACGERTTKPLTAQTIIDKAINVCGGELYTTSNFSFDFRDKSYALERNGRQKLLKRISITDTATVVDIKQINNFERFVNDSLIAVPDSLARKYGNSINSVHYFAYLPYGLNDKAVNKELLGNTTIRDKKYYKIRVSFDQQGGGDDFEDVYIYWFNATTFKPDYLAYEFHVDGGGMRFREAYNERVVNGIRFVDYKNYKPTEDTTILEIEKDFEEGKLELLSKIELRNIVVTQGNYN